MSYSKSAFSRGGSGLHIGPNTCFLGPRLHVGPPVKRHYGWLGALIRRTYGRDEQTDIHTGQAIPVTIATIRYEMLF